MGRREGTRARLARLRREAPQQGAREEAQPPAQEETQPPAQEETQPPAREETQPPAREVRPTNAEHASALDEASRPEGSGASAAPDPARAVRLERLRSRLAGRGQARREHEAASAGSARRGAACAGDASARVEACPRTAGPPERLEEFETPAGTALARVERFAPGARHGEYQLEEAFSADPSTWPLLTGDGGLARVRAGDAVFLDTETTGLSGGVGTFVWMVGLGRFLPGGGFEVWQAYLPGPEAEVPFLHAVAERIAAAGSVVSFFGRSYDQHRLLDRLRVHGLASPFDGRPHLDLFAPLRRLVGEDLPNHRLQTLERELCSHQRVDDLPGAAAPEAWFDSLAGRAHRMEGVFRHNLEDVLSLVTLFAAAGRSLAGLRAGGEALAGCGEQRRLALARAALERRSPAQAAALAAPEVPSRAGLRWRWLALRSLGLARSGQVAAARALLEREGELDEPEEEAAARDAVEAALLRVRLALRACEPDLADATLSRARVRVARAGHRVRGLERRLAELERRLVGS
jgi:uncharacterized protein YprB with RNaseH-like and TPR domain